MIRRALPAAISFVLLLLVGLSWAPDARADSNVASGRRVSTSSATGNTQYWQAGATSFPQWRVIDLGALYTISSIGQTFPESGTWNFKIEASNTDDTSNDAFWVTLADHSAGASGTAFNDTVTGNYRYIRLYVTGSSGPPAGSLAMTVNGHLLAQSSASIPAPQVASPGGKLVGAQTCNLWGSTAFWQTLVAYPDRKPIMGFYDEAYDVVTDWQIKMALEHGINFFQTCWYRQQGNAGHSPVFSSYDQFINSIANTATYRADMGWDIAWDNGNPCCDTVTGEADFVDNIVPFWVSSYFKKSNYLKIGNKPVVSILQYENFITQMGGMAGAQQALAAIRSQARAAGFDGAIIMTVNNQLTTATNADAQQAGFDYVYAYHIPTFTGLLPNLTPTNGEVFTAEVEAWQNWQTDSQVPTIVSASVGWDDTPWGEPQVSWLLTPNSYAAVLSAASAAMDARPASSLGRTMILLDNWNEYGEGHYFAPTAEYKYGYLDAIAAQFSPQATPPDQTPNPATIPHLLDCSGTTAASCYVPVSGTSQ